jgi:hypothetical protein
MSNVAFLINKRQIPLLLKTYIICIFLFVSILFIIRMIRKDIYICHEDEMIYYNSAKLFYETNSLKAGFCINENRSSVGEFNWYGPGYAFIYGSVAKMFGFTNYFFVAFHYALFILCLLIIWKFPFNKIKRLLFLAIFLSTYASFSYIFTYFPEELNLFFSLLLLLLYAKIKTNKYILIYYVILIITFSLVRVSFIFWIFTIFFIKDSPLKKIFSVILSLLLLLFILVYIKLFNAPAFVQGLKEIYGSINGTGFVPAIIKITKNGLMNGIALYENASSSVFCIVILLIIAVFSVLTIKQSDLINWGLVLLLLMVWVVFLLLYVFLPMYIEKQLLFFIPVCIYLIIRNKKYISLLLFFSIFLFAPYALLKTKNFIDDSKKFYYSYQSERNDRNYCSSIFNNVSIHKKEINVLFQYQDFNLTYLPVSFHGIPILYTTNVLAYNYSDSLRYKRFNKISIDYILAKHQTVLPNYRLIKNAGYYFLYEQINHK